MLNVNNANKIKDLNDLNQIPGFTGASSTTERSLAADYSLIASDFSALYEPQKTLTIGSVTVKVAQIEAITKEVRLTKSGNPQIAGGDNTAIQLSDVILNTDILFQEKLNDALDWVQGGCESFSQVHTDHKVVEGKIISHHYQIKYNDDTQILDHTSNLFHTQFKADQNLSENVVKTLNDKMLDQYPLIKSEQPCKNLSHDEPNSLSDVILSRTYSSDPAQTELQLKSALNTYGTHYTSDIIKTIALGIAKGDNHPCVKSDSHHIIDGATYFVNRCEPLKIVHCQDADEMAKHAGKNEVVEIGGYYSTEYNVVTFNGNQVDGTFMPYFIHEAAHGALNMIFKNKSKPYHEENSMQKTAYEAAEFSVFKNVAEKLGLSSEKLSQADNTSDLITLLKVALTQEKQAELGLNKEDMKILSEFSSLINDYKEDMLTSEVIVRIPQLLSQGISLPHLEGYLKPLMDYWDNVITPEVNNLQVAHQLDCASPQPFHAPEMMTRYCIADLPAAETLVIS